MLLLRLNIDLGYSHGSLSIVNIGRLVSLFFPLFFCCRIIYAMMLITIMVITPLDAIGYINCFCEKNLRLFSSMLAFMSSSFSCNLLNFARCCDKPWRVSLLLDTVFCSRNSYARVIFNSGKYVSMSVSNIASFDCIVMSCVVSLRDNRTFYRMLEFDSRRTLSLLSACISLFDCTLPLMLLDLV